MITSDDYTRSAILVKVIDGDTLEINIDVGFRIWKRERIRVLGVNCPEMKGATRPAGEAAKQCTENWFAQSPNPTQGIPAKCIVRTHLDKTDSFGRLLAEVYSPDGTTSLADWLLNSGNAVVYKQLISPQEALSEPPD